MLLDENDMLLAAPLPTFFVDYFLTMFTERTI